MKDKIVALIGEDADESVIEVYINRAVKSIYHYLNNDRFDEEYIMDNFEDAIVLLVENMFSSRGKKYIKSITQGKRSISYSDDVFDTIPNEVKYLLPSPFIRFS